MATVCGSSATKVVTQNGVHPCVQSSSSFRGERIAFLSSCNLPGLRIGCQNGGHKLKKDAMVVRMGIRAVESFDATFQLTSERGATCCAASGSKLCAPVLYAFLVTIACAPVSCNPKIKSDQLLRSMLVSESFNKQVARDCALGEDFKPEFSGEIFQPVPWSQTTKHGMLPEYEKYYHDSENYVIVNVPPQIMFKAKIFKPSRLCAIFKKVSSSA